MNEFVTVYTYERRMHASSCTHKKTYIIYTHARMRTHTFV